MSNFYLAREFGDVKCTEFISRFMTLMVFVGSKRRGIVKSNVTNSRRGLKRDKSHTCNRDVVEECHHSMKR